ncbi:unnamed protein product [Didymodactylos carnosus]|uniref:Uncharacterized protein n=1 Tax=Didymodactylos carnosus TaxID=1234261 RepID=A0A8S2EEB1_9BILA|nr:unnamed protein product [Didymodactylos carnosus]CAF3933550.1 unnamed protein product [Didymodactylos carnosus]
MTSIPEYDYETIYGFAKQFKNLEAVLMYVSLHPESLTLICNHNWSILHQVVFSGMVKELNQLLALQKKNGYFRLLSPAKDETTVLDIVEKTKDQHPPHHLACVGKLEVFKSFAGIPDCEFDLNLKADNKTINQIAREYSQNGFAEYIEELNPILRKNQEYVESDKPSENIQHYSHLIQQKTFLSDDDDKDENCKSTIISRANMDAKFFKSKPFMATNLDDILQCIICPISKEIFEDPGE